jgi:hypothetical protein
MSNTVVGASSGTTCSHERAAASARVLLLVFCLPGRDQIHTLLVISTAFGNIEVHLVELVKCTHLKINLTNGCLGCDPFSPESVAHCMIASLEYSDG